MVGRAHELKGRRSRLSLPPGQKQADPAARRAPGIVAKRAEALAAPVTTFCSPRISQNAVRKDHEKALRHCEGRAWATPRPLADPNVVASLKDQYEDKEG